MITTLPADPENLEFLAQQRAVVIALLGPFQLFVAGERQPHLSKTGQQILAFLALRGANGTVRAELAQAIWPNATNDRALFYLRRGLTEIRKALGPERQRLKSDDLGRITLDLSRCLADVAEFKAAARSATGDRRAEAARWYGGKFLMSHEADWVLAQRQALIELFVACQESVAAEAAARNDHRLAVSALQSLLREDPLNEGAVRQLISQLASAGDPAAATRTFQEFRRRLKRELGLAPTSETEQVHRQVVAEYAIHRRSDEAPAFAASSHRLPYASGPLIGRVNEHKQLHEAMESHRLVTLVGVGGVGKTRLGLAVAHELEPGYSKVAAFNFREAVNEDPVTTFCGAFGVHYEDDQISLPELTTAIGDRKTLLFLDNAESVSSRIATLVKVLLAQCPELRILTTSRIAFGLAGEYVMKLAPWPVAIRPKLTRDAALESEAVQFFVQRAQEAKPDFTLTNDNAHVVAELCERVDGLPFALELAAVQLRRMSLRSIIARLEDHTALSGSANAEGHGAISLETVMSWSYDLLTEPERLLFENLAVFPDRWSPADAAQVANLELETEDIEHLLGRLVEHSLVSNVSDDEIDSYRYLDTVRSYALQQLGRRPEAMLELQLRHARRCLSSVDASATLACPEVDFQVAVARCLAIGSESSLGLAMVLVARRFTIWNRTYRLSQGLKLALEVIEVVGEQESDWLAELLFRASGAAHTLSRYGLANRLLERACKLADQLDLADWSARSLLERGELAANEGYLHRARELLAAARVRYAEAKDRYGVARCDASLGFVAREEADYALAQSLTEQALAEFVEINDDEYRLWCLGSLGAIHERTGDFEAAESRFQQTLLLQTEAGNFWAQAWNLSMLAQVSLSRGRFDLSVDYAQRAIEIHQTETDSSAAVWALSLLGRAKLGMGELEPAESAFKEALALQREAAFLSKLEIQIYQGLAEVQEQRGNLDDAAASRRIAEAKQAQLEVAKVAPLTPTP